MLAILLVFFYVLFSALFLNHFYMKYVYQCNACKTREQHAQVESLFKGDGARGEAVSTADLF